MHRPRRTFISVFIGYLPSCIPTGAAASPDRGRSGRGMGYIFVFCRLDGSIGIGLEGSVAFIVWFAKSQGFAVCMYHEYKDFMEQGTV